ncbi:acyl-CoA dehydrogenase family protein [Sphingopyxis sp.]|uniref:acyl-CoA dehydrogenase family protein n=1 Tax=Sphingopyxis sp. TaxID=1908224 RepID=UPI00261DC0A6|nr:acyl-CoA dehydrogenase family protein [Sphingopyxis sp.]MCW0197991.1 acyl-CoA dehydrogenase family protein [Sphingopyxis sp.]
MDLDLTKAELEFREEVRDFLRTSLPDHVREGARRTPGVFVEPDIGLVWHRILNDKGWVAYHWPEDCGGTGWTPMQRYIFEKECAVAGAPALSVLGLRLVGPVICAFGTQEQKDRFLPAIRAGTDYWCQGYSEPQSGSDLASLRTRARRDGNDYVVDGSKIWTTHAHHANWIFCLVRTDPDVRKQAGISFLLIPMDQPGVTVTPIITMAGDHEVNQVFLDGARTPVANRIGDEGQGWTIAKFLLENERGGSFHAPRLIRAIDHLEALAGIAPSGHNGALAGDIQVATRIARLRLEAEALETTELRILADIAKGRPAGPQTSLVKLLSSELHQRIDGLAMELHGYDGLQLPTARPLYGNEAPPAIGDADAQIAAARYLNSRAWTVFGGSSEVQKNIIAKTVLRL